MKRKHFPAKQIVSVLKQAELGMAVGDIVRQLGISEQTFIGGRSSMVACSRRACVNCKSCRTRMRA